MRKKILVRRFKKRLPQATNRKAAWLWIKQLSMRAAALHKFMMIRSTKSSYRGDIDVLICDPQSGTWKQSGKMMGVKLTQMENPA